MAISGAASQGCVEVRWLWVGFSGPGAVSAPDLQNRLGALENKYWGASLTAGFALGAALLASGLLVGGFVFARRRQTAGSGLLL